MIDGRNLDPYFDIPTLVYGLRDRGKHKIFLIEQ